MSLVVAVGRFFDLATYEAMESLLLLRDLVAETVIEVSAKIFLEVL